MHQLSCGDRAAQRDAPGPAPPKRVKHTGKGGNKHTGKGGKNTGKGGGGAVATGNPNAVLEATEVVPVKEHLGEAAAAAMLQRVAHFLGVPRAC